MHKHLDNYIGTNKSIISKDNAYVVGSYVNSRNSKFSVEDDSLPLCQGLNRDAKVDKK